MMMRIRIVLVAAAMAACLMGAPGAGRAQKGGGAQSAGKDGEAQLVIFDGNGWATLKFSNRRADEQRCGLFVSYELAGDAREEAFAFRVYHMHARRFFQGLTSFPEEGWLYITPTRIVFSVGRGDKSHGFDAPRAALKRKPVTKFRQYVAGMQLNFKESPSASDTGDQKFAFALAGDRKCQVKNPEPYARLLVRAVDDFAGALAEFKQTAAALKEAGKVLDSSPPPPPRVGREPRPR